ncbi:MAG: CDP-alcohol phosphatidyltransferase family protein [Pseudomonadota bacterium]
MWLTWANGITGVRALLAPACAWLVLDDHWPAAAALLTLAIASDFLDGALARRLSQASPLGGLVDHATDAAFVTLLLAALWRQGYLPGALPVLVAAAFVQYVIDSDALRGRSLRTSWLGRANGIGYFAVAGAFVYRNALGWPWPPDALLRAVGWLLVLATLISMLDRYRVRCTAE